MSQRPGYIPLQYGLTPARGRGFGFDVDRKQRYGPSGQISYFGNYERTLGPAPVGAQGGAMGSTQPEGPIRGSGPMPTNMPPGTGPQLNQGGGSGWASPNLQPYPQQRGAMGGQGFGNPRPETGGGLTVQGGPDLYRNGLPLYNSATGQGVPLPGPRGPLSNPPQGEFGRFDNRRQQFQNMQNKIAEYQAGAASNPEWDQNKLNQMQGRLNYLGRMRRSGR